MSLHLLTFMQFALDLELKAALVELRVRHSYSEAEKWRKTCT